MTNKRILTLISLLLVSFLLVGCWPETNQAPIITSAPITTATVGVAYTYDVNATDPDGDTLTYYLTVKPTNMTIKSTTGVINWLPSSAQIGDNAVTVRVSDGDLSVIQSFTIKVSKPTPTPTPIKYYTITATAGDGGSIGPSGKVIVEEGKDKTFTITPTVFYRIYDVLVDGSSVGAVASYTFTNVTAVHTIHADFILIDPVYNQTQDDHYNLIQDAINSSATYPGDTILVMAGTYPENVTIPPGRDGLQLIGSGSGVTSIAPVSGKPVALGGNLGLIDGIRIQGFTLVTVGANYAFIALSGTVVVPSTTDLELEDIVVDGGIYGIGLNSVQGITLNDVHVSNIKGGGQGALELTGVENFTFTGGSIEGNDIGVRLQIGSSPPHPVPYGPNDNIQIHNSSLIDNVTFAVENQDASTTIDATDNWWGDATGPYHGTTNPAGLGDTVSDNVDFDPWTQ